MSEVALDPKAAIAKSTDAYGKQWVIRHIRGSSMLVATRDPFRKDYVIPDALKGKWTSRHYLQEQITAYCKRTWVKALSKPKQAKRAPIKVVTNAPTEGEKRPDDV